MSGADSLIGGPPRRLAGFARGWFWTCLAAALTGGCSKPEGIPLGPLKPAQQWSRGIGPSEFGPYELIRAADGLKGAVFGHGDSLIWLNSRDGSTLATWAWPEGFESLSWGQESVAGSDYGLALFGAHSAAVLKADGGMDLLPYSSGGASFRSGSLSDDGALMLSWRSDSNSAGAAKNQVLEWKQNQWTAAATAPSANGLFDAPGWWKRGWYAVRRTGDHCQLWWTDRGQLHQAKLVGGDGTGHPPAVRGSTLVFASQDSALAFDLNRGARIWARPLPGGFDFGVHGLRPDPQSWDLLSSRGWWIRLDPATGNERAQGRIDPLWLDRWSPFPWVFNYRKSLYVWDFDKPSAVILTEDELSPLALHSDGLALVRCGQNAVAFRLP